jgi:hypothetical protein
MLADASMEAASAATVSINNWARRKCAVPAAGLPFCADSSPVELA